MFSNKDRLIASVKMRRGEGGFDLYESAGRWRPLGQVDILGTRVNTGGMKSPPCRCRWRHRVLRSNGLQSMEALTCIDDEKCGGWLDEPEHLGAPIISVDDDMAFVIGAKAKRIPHRVAMWSAQTVSCSRCQ